MGVAGVPSGVERYQADGHKLCSTVRWITTLTLGSLVPIGEYLLDLQKNAVVERRFITRKAAPTANTPTRANLRCLGGYSVRGFDIDSAMTSALAMMMLKGKSVFKRDLDDDFTLESPWGGMVASRLITDTSDALLVTTPAALHGLLASEQLCWRGKLEER
ncbi:hypothetical protein CH63R_13083 [Colletotrichum higginsianum IMI 349063]|uniref:Uncharacterized protein n=1 Tax=Colletotrichum higginsianum (strain IMI 349063) TaxID=759273 RepID=A0A1B7XW19_COLHI|nr:hypothetical protein CH63R_13083 [Colletotrichum higginsianum IMI 349063]OBR03956.1 hypothetical protein CH63R_13083 [Colletotrichum higginsianum IMI 349063]